jgi:hypothetical protein
MKKLDMDNMVEDILIIQSHTQIHNIFVDWGTSFKGTVLYDLNWTHFLYRAQ